MLDQLVGTFVGRWYVTLFGLTFLVLAVRQLGWRRTGIYAGASLAVGILAENGAVHWGVPYTGYAFNEALRDQELWVFDAPLMVAMSYSFMSYFAFATGRLLAAGPRRTRGRARGLELVVSVMLCVWALWVVDPVSRLGGHFFLGDLFAYDGPGFWFGLPLGSQLGFTLTSLILVGILTWLARDETSEPVTRLIEHPRLPAVGGYLGQVVFMAVTAFVVARTTDDLAVRSRADALAGSAIIIFVPMVVLTALAWREQLLALSVDGDRAASRTSDRVGSDLAP